MKRKWMALVIAASMVFTLGACGTSSNTPAEENTASVDSSNADTQVVMWKTVHPLFFSYRIHNFAFLGFSACQSSFVSSKFVVK